MKFEHVELPQQPLEIMDLEFTETERRLELLLKTEAEKIKKGFAIHPYEQVEISKARRNVVLERLADLEVSYKKQKECKTEDFQLITFMLKEGYLKGDGEAAAKTFIDMDEMHNDALRLLQELKDLDDQIGAFEEGIGVDPEECAAHVEVRRRHWQVVAAPWGVS